MPRPPTDDPDRTRLTALLFRNRTLSDTSALDLSLYTSPHSLRIAGTVNTDRNIFHGFTLHAARLSYYCTRQHPCTVLTAAQHIHTRPPDILARLAYHKPLVNTYHISDLRRPRARQGNHRHDHRIARALTRRGSGVDIPGIQVTCLMTNVVATVPPALLLPVAVLALATTDLKPAVKTGTLFEPVDLGIFLPQPCSSTAGSSATKMFLATSGASSRPSALDFNHQ
jgi:hypothetical protein